MSALSDGISLFLPFYNEEEVIVPLVHATHSVLRDTGHEFELILVNDGSTDSTAEKIVELEEELEEVRGVHHQQNQGYGRALATGFNTATRSVVGYLDGDGQFDPEDFDRFLSGITDYDVVVGYREHRNDAFSRRVAGRAFNQLARQLLPITVRDIDCGFKLVRRAVLEQFELKTERTVDAELLAKAAAHGCSLTEIPVSHLERSAGESEARGMFGVRADLVLKTLQELYVIRQDLP